MARQTTNYGFNISEGTDLVNPLTDIFPNFEAIDTDMKDVSDSAVGTATELLTGTVHALVRSDSDRNVFTFTATSNFEAGETFTLDGVPVTALTPDGQTLSTGCYIIGSEVLVAVKGTLMTVYVNPSKALDSDKLDGHDSTYFATASDVSDLSGDVSALSSKVGTGTLTVGDDCVDGINTLNTHLSVVNIASQCTINSKCDNVFVYKFGNIIIGGFALNNQSLSENEALITLPSTMKSVGFMRFPYIPNVNTGTFAQIIANTNAIVNRYTDNSLSGQATFVIPLQ